MRVLLIAALLLGGCTERVLRDCPPPVEYSLDYQQKAAAELRACKAAGGCVYTGAMMKDYGAERAALRACREG